MVSLLRINGGGVSLVVVMLVELLLLLTALNTKNTIRNTITANATIEVEKINTLRFRVKSLNPMTVG